MIRLWGIVLALLLVVGCATSQPHYTLRHPGMGYMEFLDRAELQVMEKFPQWYVLDVNRELNFDEQNGRFASVKKQEDGTFTMYIYESSWDLCTVEDLALVLLHEYVHVKIWDDLEESIEDEFCRAAVHELTAYRVELNQTKIKGTGAMIFGTRYGYAHNYSMATMYCPKELIQEFAEPSKGSLYGDFDRNSSGQTFQPHVR